MKIGYYLISSIIIIAIIQGLVFASIPSPPVNQEMGVYDTIFANFRENMCRNCHSSGVSEAHHLLVPQKYGCSNCHPILANGSITIVEDCRNCHANVFNGMIIRRPHHETKNAQERHCSFCHGNIVDDYDDGHYIPTYDPTFTTPASKYKIINSTTGEKSGGCEACHEQDFAVDSPIYSNNQTHHRLGSLSGFIPPNVSKCVACHEYNETYGFDSIRYCERCHAVKSLHNIQHDHINTSSLSGHGHIGSNWDCNGCHAFWITDYIKPSIDVIIPTIDQISTSKIHSENITVLKINGNNFLNVNNSTVVVVSNDSNSITLNPDSITDGQITVTIPSLNKGRYGIYVLKNEKIKSNKRPIISVPKVMMNSAKKSGSIITIKGSGFGNYDVAYKNFVNITIKGTNKKGNLIFRNVQINSWEDISISVSSRDAAVGDIATVNSVFGTNSLKVTK